MASEMRASGILLAALRRRAPASPEDSDETSIGVPQLGHVNGAAARALLLTPDAEAADAREREGDSGGDCARGRDGVSRPRCRLGADHLIVIVRSIPTWVCSRPS